MNSDQQIRIKRLVKEAVATALKEYDGDGGDYGDYGGGGYGGSVSTSSVADILLNPIGDIFNTAKWGAKTLAAGITGAGAKTLAGLLALVPGQDYRKAYRILDNWEKKGKGIFDQQYGKALSNNWAALASTDVVALAALANPSLFFGAKILSAVPGVAVDLLDLFTGGRATIELGRTLTSFQKKVQPFTSPTVPDGGDVDTSYLEEAEQVLGDKEAAVIAKKALQDPNMKTEVAKAIAVMLKNNKEMQQGKDKALNAMKTLPQQTAAMLKASTAPVQPKSATPTQRQRPQQAPGRPLLGPQTTQTTSR